MAPTTAANPNATAGDGEWTIVAGRRRRRCRSHRSSQLHRPETLTPPTSLPSPWLPVDAACEAARVAKLVKRLHAAVLRLEGSQFYHRFLAVLRGPCVGRRLGRISSVVGGGGLRIVVYGIGSLESYFPPRLQLALAVLLHRELGGDAALEVFDPVLSATEVAAASELGCTVLAVDEKGRRKVFPEAPTLFYMPHCESTLYDALLSVNWQPVALRRMVILGNSFAKYANNASNGGHLGSLTASNATGPSSHVLAADRFTTAVGIGSDDGFGEDDADNGLFMAFHDTMWHFFEVADETDLNSGNVTANGKK